MKTSSSSGELPKRIRFWRIVMLVCLTLLLAYWARNLTLTLGPIWKTLSELQATGQADPSHLADQISHAILVAFYSLLFSSPLLIVSCLCGFRIRKLRKLDTPGPAESPVVHP